MMHDHQSLPAQCAKTLMGNMDNIAHNYDVIGIDEGQFFGDVVEFCDRWANKGKVVILRRWMGRTRGRCLTIF